MPVMSAVFRKRYVSVMSVVFRRRGRYVAAVMSAELWRRRRR